MISPLAPATSRDVARHYDELDRFYRELWGEHLHHGLFDGPSDDPEMAASRLVSLVAELARIRPGQSVCDVGCGYGATARELARSHGARVVGITVSRVQFERAAHRIPAGAELAFHHGDWLSNEFEEDSFDAVVAIESLAHMADKGRFFREAARTLRPGGRLVVCAWLSGESVGRASRRLLLEPICREGELPGMGTATEYRALAREAGFRVDTFLDLTRRVRRTWLVSASRLSVAILRRREYRRLLLDRNFRSRGFGLAVFRIWLAYRVGAMRYGVLTASLP